MNHFERAKSEYEKIVAPATLKERVEKELSRKLKRGMIIKVGCSAAGFAIAVCIALLNISPSLAHAAGGNAAMKAIIKVVTFGRYQYQENGYEARVVPKKIEGHIDKEYKQR